MFSNVFYDIYLKPVIDVLTVLTVYYMGYKMRSISCVLMLLLFATNIYKGRQYVQTGELYYPELKPPPGPNDENKYCGNRFSSRYNYKLLAKPKPVEIYPKMEMPGFKRLGLRISATKCLEYIWERNYRAKLEGRYTRSFATNEGGFPGPGGRDALQGEFPHMGALGWQTVTGSWMFKCGSSLISHKFTLTAAHCSKIRKDSTIVKSVPEIVRLGAINIFDAYARPIDANILRIIVHPRYSAPKKYYDIALIELESEIKFSNNVQPLCLWDSLNLNQLGITVSSTGWGVVDTVTKRMPLTLQENEMDIIDSKLCNRLLRRACNRNWCGVREHQLCAGKLTGGVDACQGDSGGPLQVKKILPSPGETLTVHYLVGVTSFGYGCALSNLPGVYTRVSSFSYWIESIVWPDQK